jgi:hypothetical protein
MIRVVILRVDRFGMLIDDILLDFLSVFIELLTSELAHELLIMA